MRAYLSGTPECKFGLNDNLVLDKAERVADDAVRLDDCQFHQCVELGAFSSDRTISFIPPDGEFELMKSVSFSRFHLAFFPCIRQTDEYFPCRYRATSDISLPFRIHPTVNVIGTSQVQYSISVKAGFNAKVAAMNAVLRIPTPLNVTTAVCKAVFGKAKYVPAENVLTWKYVILSIPSPLLYPAFLFLSFRVGGTDMGERQDTLPSRPNRGKAHSDRRALPDYTRTAMGPPSNRCRLPGIHVHCKWAVCPVPQGV